MPNSEQEASDFLIRHGYRRCNIAACNCGSWHGGDVRARLDEIMEAVDEVMDRNGRTPLDCVRELCHRAAPAASEPAPDAEVARLREALAGIIDDAAEFAVIQRQSLNHPSNKRWLDEKDAAVAAARAALTSPA